MYKRQLKFEEVESKLNQMVFVSSTPGEYDAGGENRFKPGICNRLDRGTEGLVIAAKSYAALRDMNEIIRTDLLKKEYYTCLLYTSRCV